MFNDIHNKGVKYIKLLRNIWILIEKKIVCVMLNKPPKYSGGNPDVLEPLHKNEYTLIKLIQKINNPEQNNIHLIY